MIDSDLACFQLTIQAPYYVLMRMHHSSGSNFPLSIDPRRWEGIGRGIAECAGAHDAKEAGELNPLAKFNMKNKLKLPDGVTITATISSSTEEILAPEAVELIAALHRNFNLTTLL